MLTTYAPADRSQAPRWMVVDDERPLLDLLGSLLKRIHGVQVECFDSPLAALAALAAAPETFELVITDFKMPEMDGAELCQQIHALAPDLKVFLTTGTGLFDEASARRLGFGGLLTKPFALEKLREVRPAGNLAHN